MEDQPPVDALRSGISVDQSVPVEPHVEERELADVHVRVEDAQVCSDGVATRRRLRADTLRPSGAGCNGLGAASTGSGPGLPGKLENLTLWERVHAHLREEILANRLPPGTVLGRSLWPTRSASAAGRSREAIGRLAAEGLVTVRPRRGAVVSSLQRRSSSRRTRCARRSRRSRSGSPSRGWPTSDRAGSSSWSSVRPTRRPRDDVDGFFDPNASFHEPSSRRRATRRSRTCTAS